MNKLLGISLYLNDLDESVLNEYMDHASKLGYSLVFTSLHIPEFSLKEQLIFLKNISDYLKSKNMGLVVDIRGSILKEINGNQELKNIFQEIEIKALRIDFELDDLVLDITKDLGLKEVFVNASTFKEHMIDEIFKKTQERGLVLKACHNFYPRPETGISKEFFDKQNELFKSRGIETAAFLQSLHKPRGPIYLGLPTLETHRTESFSYASCQLVCDQNLDMLIIGDLMASDSELEDLALINSSILTLKAELIDDNYREKLVGKDHKIRYDSGLYQVRLDGFRSMAVLGDMSIEPKNTLSRENGTITLDNKLYGRYAGEVQIVTKDLAADEKVNVIGYVDQDDIAKLTYLRLFEKVRFV